MIFNDINIIYLFYTALYKFAMSTTLPSKLGPTQNTDAGLLNFKVFIVFRHSQIGRYT